VKPRSMTWFTRFLMEQYEDDSLVESFQNCCPQFHGVAVSAHSEEGHEVSFGRARYCLRHCHVI
jgi:hypothetical protein